MTENQLVARIAGLEMLAMGTFATLLAFSGNDPDLSRTKALLKTLEAECNPHLSSLPEAVERDARAYLSNLLNGVLLRAQDLRNLATSATG
jgi:hypothetical protein